MKGKILITDSLFVLKEHEGQIINAGYEIERLDKPEATEDELVQAIKGKVGYVLGGIEKLTNKIIDSADNLKAIVFTGIGYKGFIPNWEYVTQKGIAIANTPDGPTYAVAEWAVTITLAMNRNVFDLGRGGDKKFLTTKGIDGQNIGIIGLGRIGREIVKMIKVFRPGTISYYSRHRHENSELELDIKYCELNNVLSENDVIFLCVSNDAGKNFLGEKELSLIKDNALLVSFVHEEAINNEALVKELKNKRIRFATDNLIKDESLKDLPLSIYYCSNASTAFNTEREIKAVSDEATQSLLNLLETGEDKYKVN